jgi:hypothetical protein
MEGVNSYRGNIHQQVPRRETQCHWHFTAAKAKTPDGILTCVSLRHAGAHWIMHVYARAECPCSGTRECALILYLLQICGKSTSAITR